MRHVLLIPRALTVLGLLLLSPLAAMAEDKSRNLFDGKSIDDWEILEFGGSGEVEIVEGSLVINDGAELSGIKFKKPKLLPTMNYEVEIEARKTTGFDFFVALTFPFGDLETCATFVVGGWGGGVVGLSSIDNLDASENSTTEYMRFAEDEWQTIKLRVTENRIQGWVRGQEIFDVDTEGKKVSLRPGQIDMCAPFGVATFQTACEIRKFTITDLAKDKALSEDRQG